MEGCCEEPPAQPPAPPPAPATCPSGKPIAGEACTQVDRVSECCSCSDLGLPTSGLPAPISALADTCLMCGDNTQGAQKSCCSWYGSECSSPSQCCQDGDPALTGPACINNKCCSPAGAFCYSGGSGQEFWCCDGLSCNGSTCE